VGAGIVRVLITTFLCQMARRPGRRAATLLAVIGLPLSAGINAHCAVLTLCAEVRRRTHAPVRCQAAVSGVMCNPTELHVEYGLRPVTPHSYPVPLSKGKLHVGFLHMCNIVCMACRRASGNNLSHQRQLQLLGALLEFD
jgi:hypothetical protein